MYSKFILIFVILAFVLAGCNLTSQATVSNPVPTGAPTLEFIQPTPFLLASPTSASSPYSNSPSATPISIQPSVLQRTAEVVASLNDKDMAALAGYVHPQLGLRFSPYASVKDTDLVFSADKMTNLMSDTTVYTWGAYSGSGEPINLAFADYYSQFIYDMDFANAPQLALNHRLGVSTSIDNSLEYYLGATVVEYYFPGVEPQYEGMDWRSLRLVFMQENHTWYLVGIIHDQWTT